MTPQHLARPDHHGHAATPSTRELLKHSLGLKILMGLLDILECTMEDLIEPVAVAARARRKKATGGEEAGVGNLRPKRACIASVND
jgi:hypothetical protein